MNIANVTARVGTTPHEDEREADEMLKRKRDETESNDKSSKTRRQAPDPGAPKKTRLRKKTAPAPSVSPAPSPEAAPDPSPEAVVNDDDLDGLELPPAEAADWDAAHAASLA